MVADNFNGRYIPSATANTGNRNSLTSCLAGIEQNDRHAQPHPDRQQVPGQRAAEHAVSQLLPP